MFALAPATHVLLPAGQVEQARVITEGETAFGLPATLIRQANQAGVAVLTGAAADQRALGCGPEAGAVVDVGDFVQDGGEHFTAHGAVWTVGLPGRGRAIGQPCQERAIEVQLGGQRCLAVGVAGHVIGPAHQNLSVQLFDKTRWQALHGLIQQGLAGLLLGRAQAFGLELQMQRGLGTAGDQQQATGG